jgi:SAM-dependent methyltransferase
MSQNIYDDPGFFAGYSQLRRSKLGLAGAPEWPSLRALLPPMAGRRVVDLGCGFGWFCRWAAEQGAQSVLGIDLSENMLQQARRETPDLSVAYERGDLQSVELPVGEFDLAYSSLALHYVEDLGRLFAAAHRSLVPTGRFVFSIEHPVFMAPAQPGWMTLPDGRRVWPLEGYQREGLRSTDWLAPGVVKFHRTLGATLNLLIENGFSILRVVEWGPTQAQIEDEPALKDECERPIFALVSAARGVAGPD